MVAHEWQESHPGFHENCEDRKEQLEEPGVDRQQD
jgi:hypothetical protein